MNLKNIIVTIIILIIAYTQTYADIYYYKDENGTLHFTDRPKSTDREKYQVLMRDSIKSWRKSDNVETTRYDRYIDDAAKKYGVEFTLIKAVIKAESNFDRWAVSPKGARGLMQIMPENFKKLGLYNPFNPRQNIMAGTQYLKEMMNRFDNLSLAIAAYNAGPTTVNNYKRIPPYRETQTYVKRVLRYYRSYNGFR